MSAANRMMCPGFPPYPCTTLIDPAKPSGLCYFCERTRDEAKRLGLEEALVKAQGTARKAEARLARATAAALAAPRQPINFEATLPVPVRTVQIERPVFGQPDTWHPVVEVVEVIEKELVPSCPCGGMKDGPDHEKSLLHRQFIASGGDPRPTEYRPTAHRGGRP